MRFTKLLSLLLLLAVIGYSCTSVDEEEDLAPDMSSLIMGTYSYTTYEGGQNTGSGTAIIARDGNSSIQIGLEDGPSFYARNLQRIDDDMVMDVPTQDVDYYGMDASFSGNSTVNLGSSQYDGVFVGSEGKLTISLQITVNGDVDDVLLVLDR